MNCLWLSFRGLLSFVFTTQIEFCKCCVWFQCFTQWRCSSFSNAVVCWDEEKREIVKRKRIDKEMSINKCFHPKDRILWVLCLISMIHSMMLLLFLQCCYLLIWRENEKSDCWWLSFVCLLSFVFTTQTEFSECCVGFQCLTQWCCSCISNGVACWCDGKGKEWIVDGCLLCVFFLLYSLPR